MRITQGTFSYLPDFTDAEIPLQVQYALDHGWPVSIEFTDDPHPRNTYWEMWGLPMFDLEDTWRRSGNQRGRRTAYPGRYVRIDGDTTRASAGRPPRCPSPSSGRATRLASGSTGKRMSRVRDRTHSATRPTSLGRRDVTSERTAPTRSHPTGSHPGGGAPPQAVRGSALTHCVLPGGTPLS